MAYFILFLAGLAEIIWSIAIKYADGFSRPVPSIITIVSMLVSVWLLSRAVTSIPLGTAYAIWTGIGALGAFMAGIILFEEVASITRILSVMLIVAGIVGLKLSS
jgi:quaternary ammonium compound-resistance protein SugE